MRRFSRTGAAILAAAAMMVTSGSIAQGTEKQADGIGLVKGDGYVIVDTKVARSVEAREGTFYPTGNIDKDTLVVIRDADGSLPGGISIAELEELLEAEAKGDYAAIEERGFVVADGDTTAANEEPAAPLAAGGVVPLAGSTYAALPYTWTSAYSGVNIWATNSNVRAGYSFDVTYGTNQVATAQGKGYYVGYNGSEMGTWVKWYGLGVATSGSPAGATVPWGYILATTQFKAYSSSVHMATGSWSSWGA